MYILKCQRMLTWQYDLASKSCVCMETYWYQYLPACPPIHITMSSISWNYWWYCAFMWECLAVRTHCCSHMLRWRICCFSTQTGCLCYEPFNAIANQFPFFQFDLTLLQMIHPRFFHGLPSSVQFLKNAFNANPLSFELQIHLCVEQTHFVHRAHHCSSTPSNWTPSYVPMHMLHLWAPWCLGLVT